MKKKVLGIVLSVVMAAGLIAGCGGQNSGAGGTGDTQDGGTQEEGSGDYTVGMTLNLGNLTWAELADAAKNMEKNWGFQLQYRTLMIMPQLRFHR